VQWFDGSAEAFEQLCQTLLDAGTFTTLDPVRRPVVPRLLGPRDVARVEDRTFICSRRG